MELQGKRFLVVGGAGLIGSHTVDLLLQESVAEIVIFDNFSRGRIDNLEYALKDPRVRIFDLGGDILHVDILAEAMKGVDGVFHFAALWLLHCYDYPRSAFEVNIQGTFNVLESIIKHGVKRLVYSSSASVYGDVEGDRITEDHPYNNNTFYGATKIAGEHMCRSLYHRYKNTSQSFGFVGLRYMNVYGVRQDYHGAYAAVIMKMLDNIFSGKPPIIYGDGSESYDFINVRDCALANVLAMKSDVTDEFYNVGTGRKTSLQSLVKILLEITGSDLKEVCLPRKIQLVRHRVADISKAEQQLNFKAKILLRDGLESLVKWRQNN